MITIGPRIRVRLRSTTHEERPWCCLHLSLTWVVVTVKVNGHPYFKARSNTDISTLSPCSDAPTYLPQSALRKSSLARQTDLPFPSLYSLIKRTWFPLNMLFRQLFPNWSSLSVFEEVLLDHNQVQHPEPWTSPPGRCMHWQLYCLFWQWWP